MFLWLNLNYGQLNYNLKCSVKSHLSQHPGDFTHFGTFKAQKPGVSRLFQTWQNQREIINELPAMNLKDTSETAALTCLVGFGEGRLLGKHTFVHYC